jgi:hypothetical protein
MMTASDGDNTVRRDEALRNARFVRSFIKAAADPSVKEQLEKLAENYEAEAAKADADRTSSS